MKILFTGLSLFVLSILTVYAQSEKEQDDPYVEVTYGSLFDITASDVGVSGFTRKPKVYITGGDLGNRKQNLKVKLEQYFPCMQAWAVVNCEFLKKLAPGEYDLYLQATRKEAPIEVGKIKVSGPAELVLEPVTAASGTTMTLSGKFFGSKSFKLWLTYQIAGKNKKKRVEIKKPFAYANAKGKEGKSPMDLKTGVSSITFYVPDKLTSGQECELFLKTPIDKTSITFNIADYGGDLTAEEAVSLLEANSGTEIFVILDVRTPEEFAVSHIKGAINIDYYSSSFEEDIAKLDRSKEYFVYCRSGNRSKKAQTLMYDLEFVKVDNLLGGIVGFEKVGEEWIVTE